MQVKPIRTPADYLAVLGEVSALIDLDPALKNLQRANALKSSASWCKPTKRDTTQSVRQNLSKPSAFVWSNRAWALKTLCPS